MGELIRALPQGFNFRIFAVECRDIVEKVRTLQNLSPLTTAALGRAIAGVSLLSADLKFGKTFLQIKGNGPVGEILAEADHRGFVRGTVQNPSAYLPVQNIKIPVGKGVGKNGFLSVVKDLGLKGIYHGSVELISGEIAEDLAYYLTLSEQVPSVVALGVLVDRDGSVLQGGGYLIQRLPEALDKEIVLVEERLKGIPPTTELLSQGLNLENILSLIFGEIKVLEKRALTFRCTCSLERVKRALIALGTKEIKEILRKGEMIEVSCNFCRTNFRLNPKELESLISAPDGINDV